jgi:hypothetical protein
MQIVTDLVRESLTTGQDYTRGIKQSEIKIRGIFAPSGKRINYQQIQRLEITRG